MDISKGTGMNQGTYERPLMSIRLKMVLVQCISQMMQYKKTFQIMVNTKRQTKFHMMSSKSICRLSIMGNTVSIKPSILKWNLLPKTVWKLLPGCSIRIEKETTFKSSVSISWSTTSSSLGWSRSTQTHVWSSTALFLWI